MTNEEIEAAKDAINVVIKSYKAIRGLPTVFDETATRAVDALCEAARQPESLVGKRCRTIRQKAWWPPTEVKVIADTGNGTYLVETVRDPGGLVEFRGCDLELLEGDDDE